MEKSTFSVIIPTKNRLPDLSACLDALAHQTYEGLIEACVVNDGGESIQSVLDKPRNLRVNALELRDPVGQVKARQLAIERANGEWIAFCDDDDRWLPQHAERLAQALLNGMNFVYTDAEMVARDASGVVRERRTFAFQHGERLLLHYNTLLATAVAVHSSLLERAGGLDVNMEHYWDWDLWLRLARLISPVRIPGCSVLYQISLAGHNQSSRPESMRSSLERLIEKHHLPDLPSSNFWRMTEVAELAKYRDSPEVFWDGSLEIWQGWH
ncbi:glycosyltransferase family 2 protein [Alicyclobacillus tolerans]|uniref:Glycosyltransferase involved in cell wall biosynthesis n=2 Tax=Alicyclobacillus tolerans TaxID=90970 RepID=A0ABT9LTL3_9BACL|nr:MULTISPECIES: glycosyltransferase family 2 protein [Alicyclobacillus]MDP9727604.1 glycosyltransferase involved in cell wall biosynthesis [Alicyclobacillus tengchongensis]SHJ64806.1 Glycosyl transferase family 2 [Alicyclobacillus montanus]